MSAGVQRFYPVLFDDPISCWERDERSGLIMHQRIIVHG